MHILTGSVIIKWAMLIDRNILRWLAIVARSINRAIDAALFEFDIMQDLINKSIVAGVTVLLESGVDKRVYVWDSRALEIASV